MIINFSEKIMLAEASSSDYLGNYITV